jgi:iron complex transport system substrate-binding protein
MRASRVVVDAAGRSVTLPDHVQRIISLAPSVTDDLFHLGAAREVVAVSSYTSYPVEAARKPSIGSPAAPSFEQILALHPDIVLATVGINHQETVHVLEQRGIAVFVVNPVGLPGVYQSLRQIGSAIGRDREAAALVASLQARETALRQASADRHPIRIFFPVWHDPVISIGKPAYLTDLLQVIGLRSVTDDIAQEWPKVSLEAVLARDPDMLLVMDSGGSGIEKLRALPGWSTLRAIREHKILHTDERIELPSPVCFDALEELARQVPGGQ